MSADLRDRLAETVHDQFLPLRPFADRREEIQQHCREVADALLPVVEAYVAEQTATLRAERDRLAAAVARVEAWAMKNWTDEPPVDWAGLGVIFQAALDGIDDRPTP